MIAFAFCWVINRRGVDEARDVDFRPKSPILRSGCIGLGTMIRPKGTIFALFCALGLLNTLGGCYLYNGDRFGEWLEYRVEREGHNNGELVAKVKRRGDKVKWPGDSYEIIMRWPTDVEVLPRALPSAILKKDADAFVRKLCAENDDIYVIEENFNERAGEAYYNLWCRPSKRG